MTSVSKVRRKHGAITLSASGDKDAAATALMEPAAWMNKQPQLQGADTPADQGASLPASSPLFLPAERRRADVLAYARTRGCTQGLRLRGPAAAFPAPSFNNPGN